MTSRIAGLICAVALSIGCGAPTPESGTAPASSGDQAIALPALQSAAPVLKDLGPTARRVSLIVLPGDASVEVNRFTADRRNGVIDLTGKVGDVRRVRVFKGTLQMQRYVTIEDGYASPPVLDLRELDAKENAGQDETD
jgi:hypothetical protein